MPSGSLNGSTVSPKRFSGASCGTPFSTKRWVQKPIDAFGHAERRLLRLADAGPSRRHMRPGEEGQDRAGPPGLVAVVEVVGAGIVEVDGLLDEPQAERPGVEVDVAAGVAGDRRDVVDAVLGHGRSP